jgi:hypothetical protein
MKRVQSCLVAGVLLCICMAMPASSQTDLEKALKQYTGETVKGYIQPLADLFSATMQSGYYHSAAIPASGFHFSFQVIGMAAMITDAQREYDAPTPAGWTPATFKTATIFGGKGTVIKHPTISALEYKGTDGVFKTEFMPAAVPQVSLTAFGTELSIRYSPVPKLDDEGFPNGVLWGGGLRHSISQYIDQSPIDIAVGGNFSSFKVGDIIDFQGYSVGAQASKQFSVLTLYSGLNYENSTMNLKYQTSDPSVPPLVDINMGGSNSVRFTVGTALSFGIFHIFADVNFSAVTNFSAGIGLGG